MRPTLILIISMTINLLLYAQGNFNVNSISPPPQSMNFLPTVEITINFSSAVDITSFNDTTFQVWGRWSGVHKGTIIPYSNNTSVLFTPNENFFYGEQVTVSLSKGIMERISITSIWAPVSSAILSATSKHICEVFP